METKDLMIGNIVLWKVTNKPVVITQISQNSICANDGTSSWHRKEEYEPIPLVRIHLTKNGFKAKDIEDTLFVFRDGYTITVQFDKGINDTENDLNIPPMVYLSIKFAEKDIWMPIEYFHELQNAMRLFGVEKEMNI